MHYRPHLLIAIGICCALAIMQFSHITTTQKANAAGEKMLLYWDGATAPTGWTIETGFDGRFPRGETAANYASTGGTASHTPALSGNVTISGPSAETTANIVTTGRSPTGHGHTIGTTTAGAANNLPGFRSLKLISYDAGIPNVIPAGAIAMFDDSPGLPVNWTRQTAQDNNMVRVDSTVATGGADTHTHPITWGALTAATGSVNMLTSGGNVATVTNHTHTSPTSNTDSQTSLPPNVKVIIGKADADTAVVPPGLIGMFNGDPGPGWVVRSNSGGTFYQQFLEGASAYNGTSTGSSTHSHAQSQAATGGGGTATGQGAGTGAAAANHTHTLTANFTASDVHTPQYFNVVIAEKIGFTLSNYRWYTDNDAEDVTDPWGRVDIAQNTAVPTLPPQNDPPTAANELRLRANLTVGSVDLPASNSRFKLQYKVGTDASCTTGTWVDVGAAGSAEIWRYATSGVTDGTTITTSRLSPTSSVLQTYVKSIAATLNPNAATSSQTVEYDFHIEHNGAVGATQYSFRIVEPTGLLLAAYTVCPTLVTAPASSDLLRHGKFFENQTRKGFYWAN